MKTLFHNGTIRTFANDGNRADDNVRPQEPSWVLINDDLVQSVVPTDEHPT